jgi:hypothetical protein
MAKIARVPITNFYMDGDYTASIRVGPQQTPMNVIVDTGSSALALDGRKYTPQPGAGDTTTRLAQTDHYGDGSVGWTGAVLTTSVSIGDPASQVTISDANVAVAYEETADMFGSADGILGLAYAPLDDAFLMPQDTWAHKYTGMEVSHGQKEDINPYLTQLAGADVVTDIISFYTKRSFIHAGGGGASDPLNQGLMIVGGDQNATDLFTDTFQTMKVLADAWWNTNLKTIIVGSTQPIAVPARGPQGMPSNSIVDSGTNTLNIGPHLLKAIFAKFSSAQRALLNSSVMGQSFVSTSELDLASWPDITFVLEGDAGDVRLRVAASDYWQVNATKVGAAIAAFSSGQEGLAILGLPLMNGYFTIFDGTADGGRGVIMFATSKR